MMIKGIDVARVLVQVCVLAFVNARLFGVAPSGAFVPYLQPSGSPFTIVHGAYESIEIALTHTVFPFIAVAFVFFSFSFFHSVHSQTHLNTLTTRSFCCYQLNRVILGTGLVAGRALCAWACPMGLVQDVMQLVPVKRMRLSSSTTKQLKDVKYAVFGVSLLWSLYVGAKRYSSAVFAAQYHYEDDYPRWQTSDSPFAMFSPAATLFAYVPWMAIWNPKVLLTGGLIGWVKLLLAAACLAAAAVVPRFFCRYVCPLGVCFEPFARCKVLRIARVKNTPSDKFNSVMEEVCPMGVDSKGTNSQYITSSACIHCGRCVAATPNLVQKLVF